MASGIELMLKSFGFDIESVKAEAITMAKAAQEELVKMRMAIDRIEEGVNILNAKTSGIEMRLDHLAVVEFSTEKIAGEYYANNSTAWDDLYTEIVKNGETSIN
jgi:hypothetical protein